MSEAKTKAIMLFQEMSEHTAKECSSSCIRPHSCCEAVYCETSIDYAMKEWGISLKRTGHATLPLMGENGCTAAPHLRPICTVHTCEINSLGFKKGDPVWTKKYFNLRGQIDRVLGKIWEEKEFSVKAESKELNKKLARAHIMCGIKQKDLAIKHGCTSQRINQRIHLALSYDDPDMADVKIAYQEKKRKSLAGYARRLENKARREVK